MRITTVEALSGYRLRLGLSDGRIVDRDLSADLYGPLFEPLQDPAVFAQVRVSEHGDTVEWPNGADICPDLLLGGAEALPTVPPTSASPDDLRVELGAILDAATRLLDTARRRLAQLDGGHA